MGEQQLLAKYPQHEAVLKQIQGLLLWMMMSNEPKPAHWKKRAEKVCQNDVERIVQNFEKQRFETELQQKQWLLEQIVSTWK